MIEKKTKNLIITILLALTFVSIIVIFLNPQPECQMLILLPLSYFLFTLVLYAHKKSKPLFVGSFIIMISYFIRMSLTPMFMTLGKYFSHKPTSLDYDTAVLFMIYEFVIISFIMLLFRNKDREHNDTLKNINNDNVGVKESNTFTKSFKTIIFLLVIICGAFCIVYPQILNSFKFGILSNSELIQWQVRFNQSLNSTPKIIFYLVSWCIKVLKEIIVFMLLYRVMTKKKNRFKFIISLIIIVIASLISDDTLAQNLYFAIIYFLLLTEFYPKGKSKIYISLAFTVGFIFIYGLLGEKMSSNNIEMVFYNIANTLQVYFTGVYNVAVSLKLNVDNPFIIIAGDFLRSIPLFKTFFIDLQTSTNVFCGFINDQYNSQIIPAMGQSMFMFGKFLAPLIASIFTFLTLKYENKISNTKNYFDRFIFYVIIVKLACVPVIYNCQIFLQGLFGTIIPLLIISFFNRRRKKYD